MRYGYLLAGLVLVGGAIAAVTWVKGDPSKPVADNQSGRGGAGRRSAQNAGAAPVSVAHVKKLTVPVYRQGIGNVTALNTVTVHTQVDGRLLSVNFTEGQDIHKGDVIARVDPTVYKALYDQAVAKKAQDEANLANLRVDLVRYQKLAETNAGPKQQADQQVALVNQMIAQIESDQGAIDNAKASLDFTNIVSPLDGRVGLRQVDPGNVIHASDSTGIVSITQLKPIAVIFTLPQRDLAVTTAAMAKAKVVVEIPNDDGTAAVASGTILSLDNQIDVTTGTIKVKAVFPNDTLTLWPGQFATVRVIVDSLVDAKVVPAAAIRRGPQGSFVYVVSDDQKATVKPVSITQQDDTQAVVATGLDYGQTIVTEGFAALTDGKAIQVIPSDSAGGKGRRGIKTDDKPAAAATTPPAPGAQGPTTGPSPRADASGDTTPATASGEVPTGPKPDATDRSGTGGKHGRRNRDATAGGAKSDSPASSTAAGPTLGAAEGTAGAKP